jgi:hypothetical protein
MPDRAVSIVADTLRKHQQADEWGYPVEECRCGATFAGDYASHVAAAVVDALLPKPEQPETVVRRAAALRFAHYLQIGAHPLEWSQLTDAQKLPWLLKSAAWVREPAEEGRQ